MIVPNVTLSEDNRQELPVVFFKNEFDSIKFAIVNGFDIKAECAIYFDS